MFKNIKADARRYFEIDGRDHQSFSGRLFILFFAYGLQATVIYRFGSWIDQRRDKNGLLFLLWFVLNPVYLLLSLGARRLFGIAISRQAQIGKGFYVGHFGGIEVGNCRIGEYCNVHQLTRVRDGAEVGRNVWIGGHAVIESGVVLEDYTTVNAAAYVDKDTKSYCLVSGNPARTIKIDFDNSEMLGLPSISSKQP